MAAAFITLRSTSCSTCIPCAGFHCVRSYYDYRQCARLLRNSKYVTVRSLMGRCAGLPGMGPSLLSQFAVPVVGLTKLGDNMKPHEGARADMRFDPGGGKDGKNGIERLVVNLALAGGLTYLTVTGKLGWVFDAIVSLWLLAVLVPIIGFAIFFWFAEREMITSACPNCGNSFQVFKSAVKDDPQFCPYCSQPFKLKEKQFVRDEPRFSTQEPPKSRQGFGGFRHPKPGSKSQDFTGTIVDIEAEVRDRD